MKKYIVFKIEEFDKAMDDFGNNGTYAKFLADLYKAEVQDAEVIRHQDVASAPIFSAYAHMIISMRDLLCDRGDVPKQYHQLTEIAHHFHEAAEIATSKAHKRLPD